MSGERRPFGGGVRGEIMAVASLLVAALGVTALGHGYAGITELMRGDLTRRGLAIGELLVETGEPLLLTGDELALRHLLREVAAKNPDVSYAYAKDAAGRVRAHSFPRGFPRGLAALGGRPGERGMRLIDTAEEGLMQDVSVPVLGGRAGSVHIGMRQARVRRRVAALALAWALAGLALLAAGLGAAWWFAGRLVRRIDRLIAATEEVARGNLGVRAGDGSGDELGRLARAFDRMTEELERSRGELLRAGKLAAVGELASGVAHEINNPLNTMGVCCQSLLDRSRSPRLAAEPEFADFPEYLGAISEEILRCRKITGNLLDFARASAPSREPVSVNELIRAATALAALGRAGGAGSVELELAEGLPPVLGDGDQLRQVLLNLLTNAFDQLPAGGRVRVSSARDDGCVALTVADDGPGIAPEHLARLFEPFFTTKPPGRGTGLGLAISRRIVESHGGRITARSSPGRGASFTVLLPVEGKHA